MKKILSLILCLVMAVFALVSCAPEVVDPIPEHYPPLDDEVQDVKVNMYIIYGEDSNPNAIETVGRQIAADTLKKYHTELNVKYVTAAQYEATVMNSIINPDVTDEVEGNIVLIHNAAFMDKLEDTEKLLNLADYLKDGRYGALNVTIPQSLLLASKSGDALYAIPNNRVLGEYTYLVINEAVARDQLKYSPSILSSYKTYADTEELRLAMDAEGFDPNKYVTTVTGTYATKAELEANGNICNIISVPQITAADAFQSAFAIVDSGDEVVNDRAMEIIYALNNDSDLRDLLQYGVKNTNYTVVDGNVVLEDDIDKYRMNYIYTGNAFVLSYCEAIGWTEEYAAIGRHQNIDSVYAGG